MEGKGGLGGKGEGVGVEGMGEDRVVEEGEGR